MRVLLVSIFTIIVVALGLIILRQYGLSQSFQAFSHPLLEQMRELQVVTVSSGPERSSMEWITRQNQRSAKWIALDLRMTADQHFFVFPAERTGEFCDQDLIIGRTSLAELLVIGCQREYQSLSHILTTFPEQRFWLSLKDNMFQIHKNYETIIRQHQADQRVITHSDFGVVVASIRKLQPGWIFASGQPDEVRLIALHSLYLETLWSPKADVVTLHYRYGKRPQIDERLIAELHRRKKKVFVIAGNDDQSEVSKLPVDGLILDNE